MEEEFGLELEKVKSSSSASKIVYVKVHAPWDVLCLRAEMVCFYCIFVQLYPAIKGSKVMKTDEITDMKLM